MTKACVSGSNLAAPLCDIENTVAEVIPYLHIAKIVHLILGGVLLLACFWRLSAARVILYWWILREMLEV